jgi:predicted ATPase
MVLRLIYYNVITRKKSVVLGLGSVKSPEDYLIYPENISEHLSIDELSLSKGDYTFVTTKMEKKDTVAVIKGTKSQVIIDVLNKIVRKKKISKRNNLDMANNMQLASRMCFLKVISLQTVSTL